MSKIPARLQRIATQIRTFATHRKVLVSVVSAVIVFGCVSGILLTLPDRAAPAATRVSSSHSAAVSAPTSAVSAPVPSRKADILAANKKNPDVVGWLTVPGTNLDMPIVHSTNNTYYLKHNLEKQSYWKGWPFLDYRNDADNLGRNSIIYGHNMGDGDLFGQLEQFRKLDFLNQHPVLYFGTGSADRYWKIFAVYTTDVNFYYIQTDFANDNDFASLVTKMRAQSLFNTTVDVLPSDQILTLSTCTYDFKDARFAIEARLVRPGESYAVANASNNPNPVSPHHKASS